MSTGCCHIVGAAPGTLSGIDLHSDDLLIAADGGYLHCVEVGLTPDLVLGDFDSMPLAELEGTDCEHVELPCEKDDTDILAAVRKGLSCGYDTFHLYCGFSTDVAHSVANLQVLAFLDENDACGCLHTPDQTTYLLTPSSGFRCLAALAGTRVSVFAFGGPATGVELHGFQWNLTAATITSAFPVGVSNVVTDADAAISVESGRLLVVVG
jgi:thiamine pyrophosphokinase